MGYRSDLIVLIYPDTTDENKIDVPYEALKTIMNTAFKEVADAFDDYMEWIPVVKCLKFSINDVKWYESDPDVQNFDKMMEFFRNDEHGYATEFIRIGEDDDDSEIHRTGSNVLYLLDIRRSIECAI